MVLVEVDAYAPVAVVAGAKYADIGHLARLFNRLDEWSTADAASVIGFPRQVIVVGVAALAADGARPLAPFGR
jgi:hypothetical protein